MSDSYFLPSGPDRFQAAPDAVGPWDPRMLHGGPPNALAVAVAERALQAGTGRSDLVSVRLAADFVGPVPLGELRAQARIVRAARSAALVEVSVAAAERDCLLARVWFVRATDTSAVSPGLPPATAAPTGPGVDNPFPYGESLEWRFVRGNLGELGPGAAWIRTRLDLLPDYEWSGLARTVLIADSGNGISAALDWTRWTFLNVDLDVHLARQPHGEWMVLDAETQLGPDGSGLARSTISDAHGVVGAGLQTLVVARQTLPDR